MGRSSTGIYKPRSYKTTLGQTRYRAMVPVGYYPSGMEKRKTITAATYRLCQQKLADLLKDIQQHGTPIDTKTETLGSFANRWLANKKLEVKPKTFAMYHTIVERHFEKFAGYPIDKIKPSNIRAILNDAKTHDKRGDRTDKGASISLKRQIHTTLNQIMMAALADGVIQSNPVVSVPVPKHSDRQVERTAFSVPEMKAMLQAASNFEQMDPPTGARMWFRLLTGTRQGEILGAQWDSYDPRKSLYTVNWKLQEIPREHGCGKPVDGEYPCGRHKGGLCPQAVWRVPNDYDLRPLVGRYALTRPKSQTGRIIPIIPPLQAVLDLYRKATKGQSNPFGLMFHHEDGSPITEKQDTGDFNRLMGLAGIDPVGHTGHETRHSVVTLLASQGVDFQLIREIVGHSSDAMVAHYRHADDAERLKAMETLDASLGLDGIGWKKKN